MFRNLYRVFPSSVSASTTNTTLISLKLLKSNSNSLRRSSSSQTSSLKHSTMSAEVFYNLETPDIKKNPFNFSAWKGNVVLLVNVASKCGYTPQYSGLESLYNKYKDQGLVVAGLPCNQFGAQEPGTEEEIVSFCSATYNVTFPLFAKIDVNGENESPVYKYLKSQQPVVKKYTSSVKPEEISSDIENLIKE
ncbi:unnamed protein product [Rhizophagus irregularis]|nr:unnamed protein product [Rhizophagus irregularis]